MNFIIMSQSFWVRVSVFAATVLALSSCQHPPPPPPSVEEIEKVLPRDSDRNDNPVSVASDFDFYIDDSESMRGYPNAPDSQYVRTVNHILDEGAAGHLSVVAYRFSSGVVPIGTDSIGHILSPSFYSGADTPLSRLLTQIGQRPHRMSVILSDMVQSDILEGQNAVVAALRSLAQKRLELRLLGFRSSFEGPYYVETGRSPHGKQESFTLSIGQKLKGEGRPFYLLAIAPDRQSLDRLNNNVLATAEPAVVFNPADAALAVQSIAPGPKNPLYWGPQMEPRQSASAAQMLTHFSWFCETNPPAGDESKVEMRVTARRNIPVRGLERIQYLARKITYMNRSFATKPTDFQGAVTASSVSVADLLQYTVTYTFPRPAKNSWDVYHLRWRAGESNLALPQWVDGWSTDDDHPPRNGNRTFRLRHLVEAMVSAIADDNTMCEQYIALGRGN
jgi:hypothetical protein